MAEIIVYTTDFCAFCQRAKQLLASRGLQYTEINLARDHEGRAELLQRTGLRTFPQIIV